MWDFLLGEFRLPTRTAQYLTWWELDHIWEGHAKAQQAALAGHRLVAVQVFNSMQMGKDAKSIGPEQYLPLTLVDGPPQPKRAAVRPDQAFLDRMAARLGTAVILAD